MLILRRHPFTFLPYLFLTFGLLLLPIGAFFFGEQLAPTVFADPLWYPILVLAGSAYTLCIIIFFFSHFVDFYLDVWIVTNERIIDTEQKGLFGRTISELELYHIQDVTSETHGFFPTILSYGNIMVKTASSNTEIVFYDVDNPNSVREEIIKLAQISKVQHDHAPLNQPDHTH